MKFAEHTSPSKRLTIAVVALLGSATFCAGSYSLIVQIVFALRASARKGTVVEVRHELVPQGKGSVLAYIPVVQVSDADNGSVTIRVDTYDEEPIYKIGQQLNTLCDFSNGRCIPNTWSAMWGDALVLFCLSFVLWFTAFKFKWW